MIGYALDELPLTVDQFLSRSRPRPQPGIEPLNRRAAGRQDVPVALSQSIVDADLHPAECIDDMDERVRIEHREVVDADPREVLNGEGHQLWTRHRLATSGKGPIKLRLLAGARIDDEQITR